VRCSSRWCGKLRHEAEINTLAQWIASRFTPGLSAGSLPFDQRLQLRCSRNQLGQLEGGLDPELFSEPAAR